MNTQVKRLNAVHHYITSARRIAFHFAVMLFSCNFYGNSFHVHTQMTASGLKKCHLKDKNITAHCFNTTQARVQNGGGVII
jgi:hypothetical protein